MAEVTWSKEALANLSAIRVYIADDNPAVADRVVDDLYHSVERLREFPHLGRLVEELMDDGVREIIVGPYHVAYDPSGEKVSILRIWHGKRLVMPGELPA